MNPPTASFSPCEGSVHLLLSVTHILLNLKRDESCLTRFFMVIHECLSQQIFLHVMAGKAQVELMRTDGSIMITINNATDGNGDR